MAKIDCVSTSLSTVAFEGKKYFIVPVCLSAFELLERTVHRGINEKALPRANMFVKDIFFDRGTSGRTSLSVINKETICLSVLGTRMF